MHVERGRYICSANTASDGEANRKGRWAKPVPRREFNADEWFGGCALATLIASVVSLPALTVIIVVLWAWEHIVRGASSARDKDA